MSEASQWRHIWDDFGQMIWDVWNMFGTCLEPWMNPSPSTHFNRQDGPASGRSGRSLTAEEKEAEKARDGDFWNIGFRHVWRCLKPYALVWISSSFPKHLEHFRTIRVIRDPFFDHEGIFCGQCLSMFFLTYFAPWDTAEAQVRLQALVNNFAKKAQSQRPRDLHHRSNMIMTCWMLQHVAAFGMQYTVHKPPWSVCRQYEVALACALLKHAKPCWSHRSRFTDRSEWKPKSRLCGTLRCCFCS